MALPTTGFSAIGIEEVEWGEFITAWSLRYMNDLLLMADGEDFKVLRSLANKL